MISPPVIPLRLSQVLQLAYKWIDCSLCNVMHHKRNPYANCAKLKPMPLKRKLLLALGLTYRICQKSGMFASEQPVFNGEQASNDFKLLE
jgi:hypothetical protein